jgi:hypothetical protein
MRAAVVAVIGARNCSEREAALAEQVGKLLAERGAIVVCGGGGGVMEAACKGAREAGGFTVGILSGSSTAEGNSHLSLALPTGLGNARNALVAQAGNAVIAIGGGPGTLSEIALAVAYGRTVIGLETWQAQDSNEATLPVITGDSAVHAVSLALDEPL